MSESLVVELELLKSSSSFAAVVESEIWRSVAEVVHDWRRSALEDLSCSTMKGKGT
jgi:hypothetical protein